MNLFYAPDITSESFRLNREESKHLIKVLRMQKGDKVLFTNGKGYFFDCTITDANPNGCLLDVTEKQSDKETRNFKLHMAVAPTKNINRFEWFLEKATEIGVEQITPLICEHSERKDVKTDRLERVLVAAMKQSLKAYLPQLDEPVTFRKFISQPFDGDKFIAYISDEVTVELSHIYKKGRNALLLIGPEGDFSPEEVNLAVAAGFVPVKLGPSRLRTETAAVAGCHTLNLLNY